MKLIFEQSRLSFLLLKPLGFDRGAMNRAILICGGGILDDFTESNATGIFRRKARGVDPFSNHDRIVWGQYATTPGGSVKRPPDGKKSFLSLLEDDTINYRYSIARGLLEVLDLTTDIQVQSRAKRKAEAEAAVADEADEADEAASKKPKPSSHPGSASARISVESYWESPDAKKLFLGSSSND